MDSFDFDGCEAWRDYKCQLYIPPGKNEDEVLEKYKHRFYQKVIDPSYEIPSSEKARSTADTQRFASQATTPRSNVRRGPQKVQLKLLQMLWLASSSLSVWAGSFALFPIFYWITGSSAFNPLLWYQLMLVCFAIGSMSSLILERPKTNTNASNFLYYLRDSSDLYTMLLSICLLFVSPIWSTWK